MKKEECIAILERLQKAFQEKENKCYEDMAFMKKHNFNLELEAIRYRQQAFNEAWITVWHEIDKLNNYE